MAKTVSTTKPTGLTLARNGNAFTLSWKKGDKNYNAGQNFEWRTNNDAKFIANSIGKNDTSKVKQLSESDYYPNTELLLEWIEFRVRGKRAKYKKKGKTYKPTMSSWATKRLDLAPPQKPQLTATMHESQWNVCTFAWEVETSDTDIYWFNDVEWETILVRESNVTDGANLAWETDGTYERGTGTRTDSEVITEDSFVLSDGSYTRWFRVRSRGPRGASGWSYQNHVYALPYQAVVKSAAATVQPAGGFQCKVVWEAPANPSHPIDKTTVEYSITVPDANLSCPDDASWTSANVSADTENKDAVVFPIDRLLANDQCLFVRVNTEHDGVNTYGVPKLVDGGVGALSNPTLNSVTIGDNYMVTINATNASTVADSYLVILYRPASDPTREIVLGTIPHGQTSKSVQAPDWSGETAYAFGVYAAVGDSTTISHDGALMKSEIVWGTGNVPKAPENVTISATNISGTIRVEWDWTWTEADGAELSWADHEDAWESTDEPDTYELSNIRNSRWNISGLETGVKWYVKVRLKKGTGENETYGPYSETKIIDLTSAPSIPTLVLSEPVITEKGSVTASWVYTTTDGTAQTYAEICQAELTTEGIEYGDIIAHTETAQHVTINAEDVGWQTGETYYLCVRVVSASGRVSDEWSAPVPIAIAEPLTVQITSTSLEEETETEIVDGQTITRTFLALEEMPLELTTDSNNVTAVIERASSYHIIRPDETSFDGFENETIAIKKGNVESFDIEDLIGALDDGASYRLIVTVKDELGQSAEDSIDFEVHWTHQALIPEGQVVIDSEEYIAKITPQAPQGALSTDKCDIYRLSSDRPELIVKGGTFAETYVDPYPAIGQFGGYRLVFRTANGDYITADNEIAWLDIDETLDIGYTIIDFDGGQVFLEYNVDVANTWTKDFQETKYLGGSVQGDWNPAVSRTSSINAVTITIVDEEQIEMIHRLAVTPSLCHVRTTGGASFSADVQVTENYSHEKRGKIASYTFAITRVDTEDLDGMTLAEWEDLQEEDELE